MKTLLLFFISFTLSPALFSQGCSDAGFCSLGILKNNTGGNNKSYSISIGANYGAGEQSTSTFNPYLEYAVKANSHLSYQLKITSVYANGFLGSTFNLGDVFGFATYTLKPKSINRFSILSGFKIPLSYANDKNKEGKPLPLDYQSSIGTYDLIEGVNFIFSDKWELNAGVQIPIIQKNKNSFFPDEYSDPRIRDFSATNNFKRKSDVLVRVGRYLRLKKSSLSLKPNILAIYHLGKDSYENRLGKRETISGSGGVTMNAGIIATKTFKQNNELELIAAAPFIVRELRPDGLTRSVVVNIQYCFTF